MVPQSYQHPAKGHLGLWGAIIEKYTKPGDWVLDPLAGVGSTLLAALMGRNVICLELEDWMMPLLRANWEKMQIVGPMLGHTLGQVVIMQGDARALPLEAADGIITSPPWEDYTGKGNEDLEWHRKRRGIGKNNLLGRYSGYTRPDAIVTSPPYEHTNTEKDKDWIQAHRQSMGRNPDEHGTSQYFPHPQDSQNIGNMRGGDLYALLVYNRLRREPNKPVEVHLCGNCLPAEIAGSLPARTTPAVTDAPPSGTPRTIQGSGPTLPEGDDTTFALAEPKSPINQSGAVNAPGRTTVPFSKDAPSLLNGEPKSERPTTTSQTQDTMQPTTLTGKAEGLHGEALLGVSSDEQCLNETTTLVPDVDRREWLSIISKVQKKLAESGITASEIWLQSAAPATPETMHSTGCLLCNASFAGNPSKPGVPMPNTVLSLRFVTPSFAPLRTIAGRQSGYWESINRVYSECHRVLKPDGLLILVLKGFTRNSEYVDLPDQTRALCESLGFELFDTWQRELWNLSFWRTLQKRRDPASWDERLRFEQVLAFRK